MCVYDSMVCRDPEVVIPTVDDSYVVQQYEVCYCCQKPRSKKLVVVLGRNRVQQ